jgi:peptide subunit release factor 1 (eRF1)
MPPARLPQPSRIALTQAVNRLRSIDAHGGRVLSLYLGFDPSRMPNLRERRMEVDSLLAQAERRWGGDGEGSHADRMALREDVEMVRGLLTDERELAPDSARGLAIFCAAPAGLCDVVGLPEPVDPVVALEQRPVIEPLLELASLERWCVLLISHRASRVFTGTRDHLSEVAHVRDDVHRHHQQGGWSQFRYQRGVETETDWHIRGTCTLLHERFKRRAFDYLLLAGPAELHHRVEHELHTDLRKLLAGGFEIDVERATPEQARRRAMPLIEAHERRREQDALSRLDEGLAPSGHGTVGLDEVLEAINERRVQTLLLSNAFRAPGFACPSCGRLAADARPCPLDGASTEPTEDVVERAIELAQQENAEVLIVRHLHDRLAARGSSGALLRF